MKNFIKIIGAIALLISVPACGGTPQTTPSPTTNVEVPTPNPTTPTTPVPEVVKPQFDPVKAKEFSDTAKSIGGIKVDDKSPLSDIQKTPAWKSHAQYFNSSWNRLDQQQISKVRKWSQQELAEVNQAKPDVFYPFSGPDFLYATSFFPDSQNYIMIGLEPVGDIPVLKGKSNGEIAQELAKANVALNAILNFSFFRTNDMRVDLSKQGIIPILYIFLTRTNHELLNVEHIGINNKGEVRVLKSLNDPSGSGMVKGVRIVFTPSGKSETRNLYYFSTDLSDGGIAKTPQILTFVNKFNKQVTYLKAASYLMYNDSFSKVRDQIFAQSQYILQDDSGIPLRFFDQKIWDLKFHGTYTTPIGLFSNRYQPDLRKAYQTGKNIKPLNFGIGYKFRVNESNLMLADRK